MPRVLIVVNHAAYLVSHRLALIKKIISSKNHLKIVKGSASSKLMEKKAIQILKKNKISFKTLPFSSTSKNFIKDIISIISLVGEILRFKPDLIHLISPKGIFIGGLSSRISGFKKIIISVTGMGTIFLSKKGLVNSIVKFIFLFSLKIILNHKEKKIIFQNKDDLRDFKKIFKLKKNEVKIIPGSGADLNFFKQIKVNYKSKNVILPARPLVEKGIYEFIEAAKNLKKKYPDWNFCIAGSFDYKNPSTVPIETINYYVKKKIIKNLGFKSQKYIYSKASIICLPSYREGFSKSLIDAAASGIATVTTNVPGCRDAVLKNKTAFLVKAKTIIPLVNYLERLIKSEALRVKMGREAKKFAYKKFDVKNIVNQTLIIYKKLNEKININSA
tara:strand:+ start:2381 stop:3544 length:1164 start_codon:yes stop_codon:yes gene_type:complete